MSIAIYTLPILLAALLPSALADTNLDASRLGSFYTALPLYRSGAGTNILSVGIGTPETNVNLTLSTNVEFIMVATTDCVGCVQHAPNFDADNSKSITPSEAALQYTTIYPTTKTDTLSLSAHFGTELITDARQETTTRPMAFVQRLQGDTNALGGNGVAERFSDGSSGFWGLGINQERPQLSIIPSVLAVTGSGSSNAATSFTVGFEINNYTNTPGSQAGTVHWGGVPSDVYQGSFNWLKVNTTVAGGWGLPIDNVRIDGTVADTAGLYASLDPGFDQIFVPTRIAEQLYTAISGAVRDTQDSTRWNIPCQPNSTASLSISGHKYNIDPSALVQSRDRAGQTCWGSIVAWGNGSLAEARGEIRLGTPFTSGIYTTLYYSNTTQLVGIAGKPGSVNAVNASNGSNSHANGKLAGILIGTLLTLLILIFVICYGRNHTRAQSIWYRAIRRQHRFHMNAMVRGATMPPPGMVVPPVVPVMGPGGFVRPVATMPAGYGPVPVGMGMGPGGMMGTGMGGPVGVYQPPNILGQGPMGQANQYQQGAPQYQPQIQQNQPPPNPRQIHDPAVPLVMPHSHRDHSHSQFQSHSPPRTGQVKPKGFYSPRQASASQSAPPEWAGRRDSKDRYGPGSGRRHSKDVYRGENSPPRYMDRDRHQGLDEFGQKARSNQENPRENLPFRSQHGETPTQPSGQPGPAHIPNHPQRQPLPYSHSSTANATHDRHQPQNMAEQQAFLQQYSGPGQTRHPYPNHQHPQAEMQYGLPESATSSGKKRRMMLPFMRRSERGRGEYESVLARGGGGGGRKMRSWLGGRRNEEVPGSGGDRQVLGGDVAGDGGAGCTREGDGTRRSYVRPVLLLHRQTLYRS